MFRCLSAATLIHLIASASPASAQLLSERVEGLSRICTYTVSANAIAGSAIATLRVGLGQNCPPHSPPANVGLTIPPTAQFRSDSISDTGRVCVYEQAGMTWSIAVTTGTRCPLYAGMIEQSGTYGRQRAHRPASDPQPMLSE